MLVNISLFLLHMKRAIILFLVVFYFLLSMKLTATIHYCCGKIHTITLLGFEEHDACCGGKVMKKNCCKDVQVSLKKTTDNQRVQAVSFVFSQFIDLPQSIHQEFSTDNQLVPSIIKPTVKEPPPEGFPSVFLKNCVFII